MLLSDGIRLGAAMKPQAFGTFWSAGGGETCAVGAAMDACGVTREHYRGWHEESKRFEHIAMIPEGCKDHPEWKAPDSIATYCVHLNDVHRMTREEIADIVEMWEAKSGLRPASDMERKQPIDPLADIFAQDYGDVTEKQVYV